MYDSERQKATDQAARGFTFLVITKNIPSSLPGWVRKTMDIRADPLSFGSKAPTDGIEMTLHVSLRRLR